MKKKKDIVSIILDYGILLVLIALIIVFSFASSNFFTVNTLITILRQVSITGITSVGMCYVILTGGIDLSVGSIACLAAVVAALSMSAGHSGFISSVLALLLAVGAGALNGFCVTKLSMPPLIATLGTQTALRGIAYIVTDGLPVHGFSKTYGNFAKATLFGIPLMILLMIVIFLFGKFLLERCTFGRYVYGVGGNEEATHLSGINVVKIKTLVYTFAGLLSGIAGLVLLSRTNSGQPSAGDGYEMDAITAVALGGVNLAGGEGQINQVMVGVILMGVLSTGMIMCGINDYVQKLVKGIVLILAVAFTEFSSKVRSKRLVVK
jgi:ribose transport system permease protein